MILIGSWGTKCCVFRQMHLDGVIFEPANGRASWLDHARIMVESSFWWRNNLFIFWASLAEFVHFQILPSVAVTFFALRAAFDGLFCDLHCGSGSVWCTVGVARLRNRGMRGVLWRGTVSSLIVAQTRACLSVFFVSVCAIVICISQSVLRVLIFVAGAALWGCFQSGVLTPIHNNFQVSSLCL